VNGIFKDDDMDVKIVLMIKGIEIIAMKIAENGSGLKLKYCPFENGSVNKKTMSTATIRTIPQEIRKRIFEISNVEEDINEGDEDTVAEVVVVLGEQDLRYLNMPTIAPIDTKNIPITRTKCGGLNKPSNPKVVCHKKSNGPAVI
jgi:hypothetical protein